MQQATFRTSQEQSLERRHTAPFATERLLASIVESSDDAIIGKTLDGTITTWNDGAARLFGFTADEAVGRHISLIIPPDRRDEEERIVARLKAGERVEHFETFRQARDGRRIPVSLTISPINDAAGQVVGASKIARDITRSWRENRLRAVQEAVTRALVSANTLAEAAPGILQASCESLQWQVGCLWHVDARENVLRCSALWHDASVRGSQFEAVSRERTFVPGEGLIGRVWVERKAVWIADVTKDDNFSRAPSAEAEGLHAAVGFPIVLHGEVLAVIEFFSDDIREPDNDVLQMMTAIGAQIGQFIERRRTEEALRDSEHRLRLALEAGRMGTWEWDLATNRVVWSAAFEQIHGRSPGGFSGTYEEYQDYIHPEDRQRVLRAIDATVEQGDDYHIEYRIVWPDESVHWVEGRGKLFRDAFGRPTRMIGVCADITQRKDADEALRRTALELQTLLETLPVGVFFAHDPQCRLITGNRTGHELLRTRADSNLSKSAEALDPSVHFRLCRNGEEVPSSELPVQRAARGEYVVHEELEIVFDDGHVTHELISAAPLLDEQGAIRGAVAAALDVTDRKRAEQRLKFLSDASRVLASSLEYETTLKNLAALAVPKLADWCAIDLLEDDESIRRVAVVHSDPAKVQLGLEMLRRYPLRLDMPEGAVLRGGQSILLSEIGGELLEAYARDAEHLSLLRTLGLKSAMVVPLVARGRTMGAISLVTAESQRCFSADDLAVAEDLARRAAVAMDNARLYQEVREGDRRKDEFLATLAHELRNPLAPISNAIELMKHAQDADALERARSMMERQVGQMVRLVDDLLDLNRITRGKIQLRKERVDLATVVHSAVESTRPFIDSQAHMLGVSLPDEPIVLDADPTRLSQVIANLLHNAAKYTEKRGRIWLTVQRDGDAAVIKVRDSGIGIATEHLPRLFEMFSQVEPALERSAGGLGIGLALVRGLVELHGGTVEAHSEGAGRGSEFLVRLPVKRLQEEASKPEALDHVALGGSAGRRVLVVDDNRDSAESLALLLRLRGNEVAIAYDGMEAVQVASQLQPDAVLLDLGLPRLNGYDAARQIRAQPWATNITLIAVSGWGQEEDKRRALEAGFDQHLTKPVNPRALEQLLSQ